MKIGRVRKGDLLVKAGRTAVIWACSALGLMLMAMLIPDVHVAGLRTAFLAVMVIGLINAVLWPILSRLTLPFLVFTFGLGALLLNGLVIWMAQFFVAGFSINGLQALILLPLGLTAITTLLSALLTIDDDASYYRSVIGRRGRRKARASRRSDRQGFVLLEIDGLSEAVLQRALREGQMPTLHNWLERGTHKLKAWETDLSCQTGASQAGILHGRNQDIPAFRWVEKENGNRLMVSTGPFDAPEIERRISNGQGLLSLNGASRSNLFSGDAGDVMFTYSQLTNMSRFYSFSWYFFYSSPYNFAHTVVITLWDIVLELYSRWRQWRQDVQPRLSHIGTYPLVRGFTNVFLREMTTYTLIGDILRGEKDVVYATFVGYDEIAHHSGVEDDEAFYALRKLDRHFSFLEQAAEKAARPYSFIVLSDHGQSKGATFKQRFGLTLEDLVRRLIPETKTIYSDLDSNQDHFGQALTYPLDEGRRMAEEHLSRAKRIPAVGRISEVSRGKRDDRRKTPAREAQVVVLASGNLGLIYFNDWKENLSQEEIDRLFPGLISGLVQHEGIGFAMVRSDESGPMVLGRSGRHYLETDQVDGEDPLADFGPLTAERLRRTARFKYVPDILVNSIYDREKDEVAAFEELIGSHGGAGGRQTSAFLMYPADWGLEGETIVGAEQVYAVLKSRMEAAWSGQGAEH